MVNQNIDRTKIKVLIIITRLNVGGPAIQALTLTKELNNNQFETLLIHGEIGAGEEDMIGYRNMDVQQRLLLPALGRELHPIKDILTFFRLIGIIRRQRPQIVHTHTAKAGAIGRAAAFVCRVPVIIHTYHGHVFYGYFSTQKTLVFRLLEKILSFFTHRIIVLSNSQKADIRKSLKLSDKKFSIVPFSFDMGSFCDCRENFSGKFRESIGVGSETHIVSIIGRITDIKNHELFIESAKRVLEQCNDVVFAVVGDGENSNKCNQLARDLGIADKVIFTGWEKNVEYVYADTDITVLTSKNEGTPVCLLESMSAGVPVVATDVGGVSDIVCDGKTGYIVPSGDAAAITEKICKLLRNPDLRSSMGQAGQVAMRELCSAETLIANVITVYKSCLK